MNVRSSLINKTSTTHERHECNTSATIATRVRYEWDTSGTSATKVKHECYTYDTSATRTPRVRHEWKILILKTTRVKTFSHHYIYYMASERLQGEEQFHSKNYLLEMSRFHAKMRLKHAPQKLNFIMEKAISKSFTLNCSCKCPCTFPHSYAQ